MSDETWKKEFPRRLNLLMRAKNWLPSDLARAAFGTLKDRNGNIVPRRQDSISLYLQGKALPNIESRNALAQALGVSIDELLPDDALDKADSSKLFEILRGPEEGTMRIRLDQLVSEEQAIAIFQILLVEGKDR